MIRTISAAFGAFLLMLGVALSVFLAGATDADLYYCIQKSYDSSNVVLQPVVRKADRAIAGYLTDGGGEFTALFNEREIAHMRDVYNLFEDMRLIRILALSFGAVLLLAAIVRNQSWSRVLPRGGAIGTVAFVLPIVVVGVWAAIDFRGAFRAMHRLLFDNMLWLLDPETDYLIRLLPQAFFERIAIVLSVRCALSSLALPLAMVAGPLLYRKWMRR